MAEIKGVQLKGALTFFKEYYGEDALNQAVAMLSAEDRALLPPKFFDSNWYPYETWGALRRLARTLRTGNEPPDQAKKYGMYIAEYLLTGVYQSLVAKDPQRQVNRFNAIHDFFYRDTASIDVTLDGNTTCTIGYSYDPAVRLVPSTCISTMGFWIRVLELSGAANVRATHPACLCNGDKQCLFKFDWQ